MATPGITSPQTGLSAPVRALAGIALGLAAGLLAAAALPRERRATDIPDPGPLKP